MTVEIIAAIKVFGNISRAVILALREKFEDFSRDPAGLILPIPPILPRSLAQYSVL